MSSARAGRRHDSRDSSVKKCQERSSGTPSADCSTLALMSSLSAPASGALCGTGIIRLAERKISPAKGEGREGKEHKVELMASPYSWIPWMVTNTAGKDQKKKYL